MEILKLVREFNCDAKPVSEEIDGKKVWSLEGIGIQMAVKNGNGRLYTVEPMLEQVQKYCAEYLQKNRAVGELNHPKDPADQVRVDPERIACKFTDVRVEGNNIYLKARPTIGTPCGDIVNNLLNNNIALGFSSRALAKLTKRNDYIQTDCKKIITLSDIVYDPSAPDAFIQGVLEEKSWVYENGVIVEAQNFEQVIEESKDQFRNMTSKDKDQVVKKVMHNYFEKLFRKI